MAFSSAKPDFIIDSDKFNNLIKEYNTGSEFKIAISKITADLKFCRQLPTGEYQMQRNPIVVSSAPIRQVEIQKNIEILKTIEPDEHLFPDELPVEILEELFEGVKRTVIVNLYERNAKARKQCIEHWKAICAVCGFDFEDFYGEIGKGFIHVHHLTPVSQIGELYQVDPINDLIPVCPNCHSMIHRYEPPLTVDELKIAIER
jgi:predicted HNH restriction endonuclease